LILSFDLQLLDNVTVSVSLKSDEAGRVKIRYTPNSNIDVDHTGRVVTFGYGTVTLAKSSEKSGIMKRPILLLSKFLIDRLNDMAGLS